MVPLVNRGETPNADTAIIRVHTMTLQAIEATGPDSAKDGDLESSLSACGDRSIAPARVVRLDGI